MLRLAAGETLALEVPEARGHALAARLDAFDPQRDFQRSSGILTEAHLPPPELARVESGYERGVEVPAQYDARLAHLVVTGATRDEAVERLRQTLDATRWSGVAST